ncbi:MAG: hypothetical protein JKX94_12880, partial [Sneathiella sp.]|nr:hypothetical protein [Sneathiella sp.]
IANDFAVGEADVQVTMRAFCAASGEITDLVTLRALQGLAPKANLD